MVFDFFKSIYPADYKDKFSALLKIFYYELIKRYSTGKTDKKGYPLLKGVAFDFVPRNIIVKGKDFF